MASPSFFWLTSFGGRGDVAGLIPVAGVASARRVDVAIAAARRRWPGGRCYRRADGTVRYLYPGGVGPGLMHGLLLQPAELRPDGWYVHSVKYDLWQRVCAPSRGR